MINTPTRIADVTVVIPTVPGREALLERAMASVRTQTWAPTRVEVELDRDREGAHVARNRALARVRTTWLAWLDDDDQLLPSHLETCLRTARTERADLVYPYMQVVGGRDPLATMQNGKLVLPFGVPFGPEQERHLRTGGNFIPVTYVARTKLVKRVGGFPAPYEFDAPVSRDCEDYGLLLRLLDVGAKFVHAPVVTWRYHIHEGNLGGRGLGRMAELDKPEELAWVEEEQVGVTGTGASIDDTPPLGSL